MSVEEFAKKAYDYIIIGGGTAGLLLAARLTEDEDVTVGVLEAGGNKLDDPLVDGPNTFPQLWDKPEYDWQYKTVPQKGTANRAHGWARGKCLGGSSAINYNAFSMCSRQDLDNWTELGNEGWGFDDLAPYFRKFETYMPPSDALSAKLGGTYIDPLLRGTNGPIQVSFCEVDTAWQQEMWPKTCKTAGYPQVNDPRAGSAIGGFNQPCTVDPKTAKRSYSARAFYEPNAHRPNLSVLTDALVSKIEFEKSAGDATATGVQFLVDGTSYIVKARKEVIVCGGVVNSPQILELSGIGPTSVLQKHDIEVVADLPVGENLNDHFATGFAVQVEDRYPTAEVFLRNPDVGQKAMEAYLTHKSGPFANAPTTSDFVPLQTIAPRSVLPDPKDHMNGILARYEEEHPDSDPAGRNAMLARQLLDPREAVNQVAFGLMVHSAPGNWITLAMCSTRAFSRGSIHITSPNPTPTIDPNYYGNPLDLDLAARAILHSVELYKAEPLYSCLKKDENGNIITHPANPVGVPKTLEEAKQIARVSTVTEYHPVGTCAMLPREKGGVVDDELKVYGTTNVRVIDASIFPLHVQGNIVSLIYAMAEKGADIIKASRK